MIGTDAFQEVDTYGISIPITKHNYLVRDISELTRVIPAAFRIAQSGRPGPVWIDIPKDVQTAEIELDNLPEPGFADKPCPIDPIAIATVAQMINSAARPVLYLGGGIVSSEAHEQAIQLAEQAGLPTTMTLMALGTMPVDHPLSLGMLGMHAARSTNLIMQQADLLIVLGARFDDRAIGKAEQFCPDASIIHIDIDPAELGKIRRPHLAMNADIKQVLTHLLPLIETQTRSEWCSKVSDMQREFPFNQPNSENPLCHYGLIRAAAAALDDETIITTDVGQHQMWVAQTYPLHRPRQWLTSGGLGTMGFGLPAAIGAALAKPQAKVVCFSGDGSLMMNIQEMATAAEEQLNVKIILMNNQSLGLVHQQQDLFFGKRIFAADYPYRTNFIHIAEGFGFSTCDLNTASDPYSALHEALNRPGPVLIHALIDVDEKVYPMVPPGAANIDMIGGE